MCRAIVFFVLLFSRVCCFAQIDKQHNSPRVGDNVDYFRVSYPLVSKKDNRYLWDLSQFSSGRKKYTSYYSQKGEGQDSLSVIENGNRFFILLDKDGIYYCGFENNQTKVNYDIPIKKYTFPMVLGDSISGVFYGIGSYCDRQKIRTFGSWFSIADAMGDLVLPSCDTLRNVIRVHMQQNTLCYFYPMDSVQHMLPSFTNESISTALNTNDSLIISDSYFWFAQGYRYPILKYQTAHVKGQSVAVEGKAYYCPPETQKELPLDDENIKVRIEISNKSDNSTNATEQNNNFKYTFSNDSYNRNIHIDYSADSPICVNAILANTAGVVYRTLSQTGNISGSIDFNYSSLQPGQYVVYIKTGTETYIEKFNNR